MSIFKKCFAEFIGTFWLVLGGCGSAVLAGVFTSEENVIGQDTFFLSALVLSECLSLLVCQY